MSFNLKGYTPYTFFPKLYVISSGDENSPPSGSVVINGDVTVGSTLTASNNISDPNGVGMISYNWYVGGVLVSTGYSYTVTTQDVGSIISVTANYTDGSGNAESVASQPVGPVIDTTPPVITIMSPTVTSLMQQSIYGAVDEPSIVVVTVNGVTMQATVDGLLWSIASESSVPLEIGGNSVYVVATDQSGNTASSEFTITRNLPPINIGAVQG